jgi:hypothetical protein
MQGFTLKLTGHLFDTGAFNKSIDLCEAEGIVFRVVSWELGCNGASSTEVTLQGLSVNEEALSKAEAEIIKVCEAAGIKTEKAKGPDFDKKLGQVSFGRY